MEQQGYLTRILANWVVELALVAIKVLMGRTLVINGQRREGRQSSSAGLAHTTGSYLLLKALPTRQRSRSLLCPRPLQFRTVQI